MTIFKDRAPTEAKANKTPRNQPLWFATWIVLIYPKAISRAPEKATKIPFQERKDRR